MRVPTGAKLYMRQTRWPMGPSASMGHRMLVKEGVVVPEFATKTQVRVQVKASSVNPIDVWVKNGYGRKLFALWDGPTREGGEEPFGTSGVDLSGVVVDVADPNHSIFRPGDHVFGALDAWSMPRGGGTNSDVVVVEDDLIALKPDNISHVEAAAVPYACQVAWQALFESTYGDLGNRCLVHGGSGGVGTFALQLLRERDSIAVDFLRKSAGSENPVREVYATCSERNLDLVRDLGATAIDYNTTKFEEIVGELDYILTAVHDTVLEERSVDFLKQSSADKDEHTRYHVTLNSDFVRNMDKYGIIPGALRSLSVKMGCSGAGTNNAKGVEELAVIAWMNGKRMDAIAKLIEEGKLSPVIEKVYALEDIEQAHDHVSSGRTRGKVVVDHEL